MSIGSRHHPSAEVRGDEAYERAKQSLDQEDLLTALNEATQAVVFRRMFYGKNSIEVRDALDLAKQIQDQILIHHPELTPRRRRKAKQQLLETDREI